MASTAAVHSLERSIAAQAQPGERLRLTREEVQNRVLRISRPSRRFPRGRRPWWFRVWMTTVTLVWAVEWPSVLEWVVLVSGGLMAALAVHAATQICRQRRSLARMVAKAADPLTGVLEQARHTTSTQRRRVISPGEVANIPDGWALHLDGVRWELLTVAPATTRSHGKR